MHGDSLLSMIITLTILLIGMLIVQYISFSNILSFGEGQTSLIADFKNISNFIIQGIGAILGILILIYIIKRLKKQTTSKEIQKTELKIFLFALILLLFSSQSFAFEIIKPETIYAYSGYTTSEDITIKNTDASGWFSISLLGTLSNHIIAKSEGKSINALYLNYNENKTISLEISLPRSIQPGAYLLTISITGPNQTKEVPIILFVNTKNPIFIENLKTSCVDCKDILEVSGRIKNVLSSDFSGKIKITFAGKTEEIPIKVNSYSSADFSKIFSLQDSLAGNYSIAVSLYDSLGNLIDTSSKEIIISEITNITFKKDISNFLLFDYIKIYATNFGNYKSKAKITIEPVSNFFEIYNGPAPTQEDSVWVLKEQFLSPNESTFVSYYKIYSLNIILLFIIFYLIYYLYCEFFTVKIEKNIIEKILPSGDKKVTVALNISSKFRNIDNVVVRDLIPSQFKVIAEFPSIKPVIRKIDDGTEIIWRLGTLGKGEERILHYSIFVPSSIVGKVHLPRAVLRGKIKEKKIYSISNPISFIATPFSEFKKVQIKVAK